MSRKPKNRSSSTPSSAGDTWKRRLSGRPAVAVVLLIFWAALVAGQARKSATYDEPVHLLAGYTYWHLSDYRINPENGNLPQRLGGIGLSFTRPAFVDLAAQPTRDLWAQSQQWPLADNWLFRVSNDAQRMLLSARAAMALLAVALGVVVYEWSRRLFGPLGGMVSLVIYVLNPTVLANGALVTSDMAGTLFFALSLAGVWAVLHRLSIWRTLLAGAAVGGLLVSKMSAPLILPMAGLLIIVRLIRGGPLPLSLPHREWQLIGRARQAVGICLAATCSVLVAWVVVWASYSFRYSMFAPGDESARPAVAWEQVLDGPVPRSAVEVCRRHRLLPEAFLYGYAHVLHHSKSRAAFLNGQISGTGWPSYFPYTFLVKTPLALLALLVVAIIAAVGRWMSIRRQNAIPLFRSATSSFYATAPLWVLLGVYWTVSIISRMNIGHRHILPVYPPMFILAGAAVWWMRPAGGSRAFAWSIARFPGIAAAGLLLVLLAEAAWFWPDQLAYFNGIVRPSQAWRHLIDSSLDWGQDLPSLKSYLDARGRAEPDRATFLSYFGTSRPSYYGIQARLLPGFGVDWPVPAVVGGCPVKDAQQQFNRYLQTHPEFFLLRTETANTDDLRACFVRRPVHLRLSGGTYCISATMLQPVFYDFASGPWCERLEQQWQGYMSLTRALNNSCSEAELAMLLTGLPLDEVQTHLKQYLLLRQARLCAFLRLRSPAANVNHSILIFDLNDQEVQAMLEGPPPPLGPDLRDLLAW